MKSPLIRGFNRFAIWPVCALFIVWAPVILAQSVTILQQPASQQVLAGAPAGMSVLVSGSVSGYQWQMNGTNLPGQTNSFLVYTHAFPTDTGSYDVAVFEGLNTFPVYSAIARLEVNEASALSTPVVVSGWNENVILGSSQFAGVTEFFDDIGNVWFESGFEGHANGLPVSGLLSSALNTNVIFRFQPYSYNFNNALRMDALIEGAKGTLKLARPAAYESISILASSSQGGGLGKFVLNFTDGTASAILFFAAYDWTAGNSAAVAGLGRAYFATTNTNWDYDPSVTELAMYETDINLSQLGLGGKALTSVTFTKPSASQVTAVFAISGQLNSSVRVPFLGATTTLTVPGTSNPWLAGMPDGATSYDGDFAPFDSPVEVFGLPLIPGDDLTLAATGGVSFDQSYPLYGPNGWEGRIASRYPGPENGISDMIAPIDALLGVFLGPTEPDLSTNPPRLIFNSASTWDYSILAPLLQQVFFIGNGLTSAGTPHHVVVPHGATRLFLGPMDGYQWFNNLGSFTASVSETNLVALSVAGYAGGMISLRATASPGFTNLIQSTTTIEGTNWVTVSSVVPTNSSYLFLDTNGLGDSQRFYRLIQLP